MARTRIGAQLVVVIAVDTDRNGDRVEGDRVEVPYCLIQPATNTENATSREQSTDRFVIYGPPGLAAARSSSLLEVPGTVVGSTDPTVRLEMVGNAAVWTGTDGLVDHIEATASRTTG